MAFLDPLSHQQLLLLFGQLFILLLVARGLGEVTRRVGYPSVLGELLAGIVVGQSLLGTVAPNIFRTVFPANQTQYSMLLAVAWIGVVMLLVITGFETDLELIARRAKPAVLTAFTGITIPFVSGFVLAYFLPAQFIAGSNQRLVFSLFIATALSISAIPVIAKILIDMNALNRDVGQITLASGMLNDTVGWILLAVVASLAQVGSSKALSTAGWTAVWLLLFLGVSFTLGRRVVEWIIRWVDTGLGGGPMQKVTVVMILAFGVGTITQFLGLEVVLGAFVVGVLVGQMRRFDRSARHMFEVITLGIFAPIFFAVAGLRVDLRALSDPVVFTVGMAVLVVAIGGKFVGTYIGARTAGLSNWESITMGSSLNARGAIEIIIATIGISTGVLTTEMYTIIVMVAIITSLIAPPLLRVSLARIEMSDEEAARLEREELERESFLGTVLRVLLPTRGSIDSQLAAQLVGHLVRGRDIEVTIMYVNTDQSESNRTLSHRLKRTALGTQINLRQARRKQDRSRSTDKTDSIARSCLSQMRAQLSLSEKRVSRSIVRNVHSTTSETVLEEAAGYDLLVLGTGLYAREEDGSLFSAGIDDVIQRTPSPLMTVTANMDPEIYMSDEPLEEVPIRRILLPTVGAEYNRHAAEVAFAIAVDCGALVEISHVIDRSQLEEIDGFVNEPDVSEAIELGEEIVDREVELGRKMGAEVLTSVSVDDHPGREIVVQAIENEIDLIVLSTQIHQTSRRAFFGHRVEQIVKDAPCPVVVISSL